MRALLVALLLLLFALPAAAGAQVTADGSEPPDQTVGPGAVVTDPAAETEEPVAGEGEAAEDDADVEEEAEPTVPDAPEPAAPAGPRRGEIHVQAAQTAPTTDTRANGSPGRRLPFTGVDPAPLVALGFALLAAGLLLRRRTAAL